MDYIIDMEKTKTEYEKWTKRNQTLKTICTICICIVILEVCAMLLTEICGWANAFSTPTLCVFGASLFITFCLCQCLTVPRTNVAFYMAIQNAKLLEIEVARSSELPGYRVRLVLEHEDGAIDKKYIGTMPQVESTKYAESVLDLNENKIYVPYNRPHYTPKQVEGNG